MTPGDKELLLKDLCIRLPYGVKIHINSCIEEQNQMQLFDVNIEGETIGVGNKKWVFRAIPIIDDEDETKVIKPYLRPVSSMTESEASDMFNVMYPKHELINVEIEKDRVRFGNKDVNGKYSHITLFFNKVYSLEQLDWLDKKMFDYRGLIPMGLALEAPEDMYKTE